MSCHHLRLVQPADNDVLIGTGQAVFLNQRVGHAQRLPKQLRIPAGAGLQDAEQDVRLLNVTQIRLKGS